jgi:hypothetical protein
MKLWVITHVCHQLHKKSFIFVVIFLCFASLNHHSDPFAYALIMSVFSALVNKRVIKIIRFQF